MNIPPDGFIRFEVDKVSKLGQAAPYVTEIDVKGVNWGASAVNDGKLAVVLSCRSTDTSRWQTNVVAEFTLVHSDLSRNYTIEESKMFDRTCLSLSGHFMGLDEFIEDKKGFIEDDKITIEVRFWLSDLRTRSVPFIDFTDPHDPRNDVALVIDEKKIYVSKQILAAHSSVFNTMFYGNDSENNEQIGLKDVDREEFIELLHVIYPSCKKITEDSAEYLLKLGDRFQMAYVIDRVEEFLIASDVAANTLKLRIADEFKLFGLQEHCLSKLSTQNDFDAVKESSIYGDLSPETKVRLFERLLSTVLETSGSLSAEAAGQRTFKSLEDKYIRAWQGPTGNAPWYVDMAPHCRMSEHWTLKEYDGKVTIRAHKVHKFLRAHPDGRVDLADEARDWEMWTPFKNPGGLWSFRSHHGRWLSGHREDGIVCTKRRNLRGEVFRLESW